VKNQKFMKVIFHQDFYRVYTSDPAAAAGRMEAIVDMIGLSAGFDNHVDDWGGLLNTEDYRDIGRMVREAADRRGAGCFGILEGGYNHAVLGRNVMALIEGLAG
jgi:acetoin utilization deacetylase AcuC-like enzyme